MKLILLTNERNLLGVLDNPDHTPSYLINEPMQFLGWIINHE